jgi:hypothetical protein
LDGETAQWFSPQFSEVCTHFAEDCDDRWLAERLRTMVSDLLAKADDFEELPVERARYQDRSHLLS